MTTTVSALHPSSRLARAWDWYFFRGYSGDSLGALRALFGAGLLLYHIPQFLHVITLDPFGPSARFLEPIWYFEGLGIDTHVPWLNIPVFAVLMGATAFFMLGRRTRAAIVVTFVCILYLKGVRDSFAGDVHHRYIVPCVMLFLFYLSKCDHRFALDAHRYRDRTVEEWEASWPIRTAQTYIVLFYFWAVVAKLRVTGWTWFDPAGQIQAKLLERSLRAGYTEAGELVRRAYAFELAEHVWVVFAFGALVAVFELLAPLVLLIRRTWTTALFLLGAGAFHVANFILLNVQFYIYPIVFLTFFDMAPFARWARKWARERSGSATGAAA